MSEASKVSSKLTGEARQQSPRIPPEPGAKAFALPESSAARIRGP